MKIEVHQKFLRQTTSCIQWSRKIEKTKKKHSNHYHIVWDTKTKKLNLLHRLWSQLWRRVWWCWLRWSLSAFRTFVVHEKKSKKLLALIHWHFHLRNSFLYECFDDVLVSIQHSLCAVQKSLLFCREFIFCLNTVCTFELINFNRTASSLCYCAKKGRKKRSAIKAH